MARKQDKWLEIARGSAYLKRVAEQGYLTGYQWGVMVKVPVPLRYRKLGITVSEEYGTQEEGQLLCTMTREEISSKYQVVV
ncbi:MAG: hypothetical protein HY399_00705 [Elusimicrobia bacterium]|nr:hypothetical protein [Elusimicrobiota bacterium]